MSNYYWNNYYSDNNFSAKWSKNFQPNGIKIFGQME